ncbi:MAG TPA: hypothetical protein VFV40_09300, partial [Nocardioides sp.]|nr:hypothetical protein [Nocardioides sp.]
MTGHVSFHAWRGRDLDRGLHLGTRVEGEALRLATPVGTRRYVDPHAAVGPREHAWAAWVSPVVTPGHPFTSLVPSWNATTPGDSWLEVEARASADGVRWTRWFTLGRWATSEEAIAPTSVPGQACAEGTVDTDELRARGTSAWSTYQLRMALHRGTASSAVPTVTMVGVVVANPGEHAVPAARTAPVRDVELAVPAFSQQLHRGDRAGSAGESWCSPTATAMVLAHWGRG